MTSSDSTSKLMVHGEGGSTKKHKMQPGKLREIEEHNRKNVGERAGGQKYQFWVPRCGGQKQVRILSCRFGFWHAISLSSLQFSRFLESVSETPPVLMATPAPWDGCQHFSR